MRTLRQTMLMTTISITMGISLVLILLNSYYNKTLVDHLSEEQLMHLTLVEAKTLNAEIQIKENIAKSLESYVLAYFDFSQMSENEFYIDTFKKQMEPYIYSLAKFSKNRQDAWIYFNPFIYGRPNDIWFYDSDLDGNPERMPEGEMEFYLSESEDKDWFFKPYHNREAYWTPPFPSVQDQLEDVDFISYSYPVIIEDVFIAVVGSDFTFGKFREQMSKIEVYDTGYAFLLTDNYRFASHPELGPDESLLSIEDGKYKWIAEEMAIQKEGIIEYSWLDGEAKLLAFTHLNNGWIFGISAHKDKIYAAFYGQLLILLFCVILGIITASILAIQMSRRLSMPIEDLANQLNCIGSGDYKTTIVENYPTSVKEYHFLFKSTNQMRMKEKEFFDTISEHKKILEETVANRTSELVNTNQELEALLNNLKHTQNKLIEAQKYKVTSNLLMEIAHRLNTPLGNSITILSFAQEQGQDCIDALNKGSDSDSADKIPIDELLISVELAFKNNLIASNIINELQKLTESYNNQLIEKNKISVVIGEIIDRQHKEFDLEAQVEWKCDKNVLVETYPKIVQEVFKNIFTFSTCFAKKELNAEDIRVKVFFREKHFIIEIHDSNFINYEEYAKHMFVPYYFFSFEKDGIGLEMMRAKYLLNDVLNGSLTCKENVDGNIYYEVMLPSKIILYDKVN